MAALVSMLALPGCSESVTEEEDAGGEEMDASSGGTDSGAGDTDSGSGGTDAGGGGGGGLVINEIDASDEWTELYNSSSSPIDLAGHRVCDSNADGTPKVEECGTFPAGFELGAGEYIVVVEGDPFMEGLVTGGDCAAGDPCVHTMFGISNGDGDTIFVLPPEGDDTPYLTQVYPPDGAADGNTYCRLPNATGDFTDCAPSPGEANAAP